MRSREVRWLGVWPVGMRLAWAAAVAVLLGSTLTAARDEVAAEPIALDAAAWRHVRFEDKPPTQYSRVRGELWAKVERSASFVLLPFSEPRRITQVDFEWKLEGQPRVSSAKQEETSAGDDLPLRVGLLLEGPEPKGFLGFGVPGWVKQVRRELKHESSRVLFLVAGSQHAPGAHWVHPQSSDIEQRAVASVSMPSGWQRSTVDLGQPQRVVGLWLMADGDDTQSSYQVALRHLTVR